MHLQNVLEQYFFFADAVVLAGTVAKTHLHRPGVPLDLDPLALELLSALPDRADGRKHFASSVLLDSNREIVAAANTVWIEIKDEAMLAQLKADRDA